MLEAVLGNILHGASFDQHYILRKQIETCPGEALIVIRNPNNHNLIHQKNLYHFSASSPFYSALLR